MKYHDSWFPFDLSKFIVREINRMMYLKAPISANQLDKTLRKCKLKSRIIAIS